MRGSASARSRSPAPGQAAVERLAALAQRLGLIAGRRPASGAPPVAGSGTSANCCPASTSRIHRLIVGSSEAMRHSHPARSTRATSGTFPDRRSAAWWRGLRPGIGEQHVDPVECSLRQEPEQSRASSARAAGCRALAHPPRPSRPAEAAGRARHEYLGGDITDVRIGGDLRRQCSPPPKPTSSQRPGGCWQAKAGADRPPGRVSRSRGRVSSSSRCWRGRSGWPRRRP